MIFSLLGAFAVFAPVAGTQIEEGRYNLRVSWTAMDLFKMGINDNNTYLALNHIEIYIVTVIAFAAAMAASMILKDKISERPYIPIIAGVVAIAGIFISFGVEILHRVMIDSFSICLTVQMVSALMLIVLNITPMMKIMGEKKKEAPKRRTF